MDKQLLPDNLSESNLQPIELPSHEKVRELREAYNAYILSLPENTMIESLDIDLSVLYPETRFIPALLEQIDDLKRCLDSFRPLSAHQTKNLELAFETEFTYDSNRIEGNTLTLRETSLILEKGITVTGKSMREHLEVVNHQAALDFVKELINGTKEYNEANLLKIHELVLHGIDKDAAGTYRRERVFIRGSRHVPPNPMKVPMLIEQYFAYYESQKGTMHPALLAADMSERLVTIHPFIDGNGRTSRLVMNFLLMCSGFPITNISGERQERTAYFNSLQAVNMEEDTDAFRCYFLGVLKYSFYRYLNAVAVNLNESEQKKGGYFFKRVAPLLEAK